MIWLAAYLVGVFGFPFVWSRALPQPENRSREIDAYQRRRSMGDLPAVPADLPLHAGKNRA